MECKQNAKRYLFLSFDRRLLHRNKKAGAAQIVFGFRRDVQFKPPTSPLRLKGGEKGGFKKALAGNVSIRLHLSPVLSTITAAGGLRMNQAQA